MLIARSENAPVLSEKTLRRISAMGMFCVPGSVNHVGIFHEQYCANALKAGAKRCDCTPDIRIIKGIDNGKVVEMGNPN